MEALDALFSILPLEKGNCRVWSWMCLNHNPKQLPPGAAIFGPNVNVLDYRFFFCFLESFGSLFVQLKETLMTSFLTVWGADSRTFKEWHQVIFFKIISCPWSLQRSHSLRMCGGWKQTLFCQARDAWGSCNRQMSVYVHILCDMLCWWNTHPPFG